MKDYVKLQLDMHAAGAIAQCESVSAVPHAGLKGTLREVFISELLSKFLPPPLAAGTGTIIHGIKEKKRKHNQDDILIYDPSLMPPLMASQSSDLGVFLYNSVICRIEVKSIINSSELKKFVTASQELCDFGFTVLPDHEKPKFFAPLNFLIALNSDLKVGEENKCNEINRLKKVYPDFCNGTVSAMCILGHGFFMLRPNGNEKIQWYRANLETKKEQLGAFIGVLSSSISNERVKRTGRDPKKTLELGLGLYLNIEWTPCDSK